MATRFPRPLARRDVLYGTRTPREKLVELGHAYLAEGLLFDAADFFCEARDREGLEAIRTRSRETGDAFLLRQVEQACPDLVSKADWDALAARARELGKDTYAERAAAGGAPPPPPFEDEEETEAGAEEAESAADREGRKREKDEKGEEVVGGPPPGEKAEKSVSRSLPGSEGGTSRRPGRGRRRRRR